MISTRAQFLAAFLLTVLGIVALARYGFVALHRVADDAARVRQDLDKLHTISEIESAAREFSRSPQGDVAAAAKERLDRLAVEVRRLAWVGEERPLLAQFLATVDLVGRSKDRDAWIKVDESSNRLEDALIARSQQAMSERETAENTTNRAQKTLILGGVVVAFFGAASAVVYGRMRREQRETQEHLRRSDRLAALGTIAASVAHEINNPLATVAGCASAVRDRLKRSDAATHADSIEYLEMIEDEARRCSGILKSLRDLAREGPPAMAPADLTKLARTVVALLEIDRNAKSVTFEVEGEDRVEAICDPDKLKQLLLNLLINARDASAAGGRVSVRVGRVGDGAARIEVIDEGRGIERRDLQRIFEPFHTDKTQGLGIGLFLCQRIAEQHGGLIRAQSDGHGKGARFVVEFPTRTSGTVPADAVS